VLARLAPDEGTALEGLEGLRPEVGHRGRRSHVAGTFEYAERRVGLLQEQLPDFEGGDQGRSDVV